MNVDSRSVNKKLLNIVALVVSSLALVATLLSMIASRYWWVQVFDYPRPQVAIICLLSMLLSALFLKLKPIWKKTWLLLLLAAFLYQASQIIVYTSLYKKQALDSNQATNKNSFRLLVSNVLMENRQAHKFLQLVRRHNPDLVLINEPDAWWEQQLLPLEKSYKYSIKQPQDNTYGMILYSRLPLKHRQISFLVQDEIPSIFAQVLLPSGDSFDFYGLHPRPPRPPRPGTNSYERDAELLIVARSVKKKKHPAVVAGDLNDVAWSHTSNLFQRYSGLLDPRQGRGLFNTYNAFIPLLRYPLDHVFFSDHFGLINMDRLPPIGSDHFPILVALSFEPLTGNMQDDPTRNKEDLREAKRKIRKGQ